MKKKKPIKPIVKEEEFEDEEFDILFPSEVGGDRSFPVLRKYKRRRHKAGVSGATIALTNNVTSDIALVGDQIGIFFVQGSSDVFTFSFVSNPGGLFSLLGPVLQVGVAPLTPGFDVIVVKADNGAGLVLIQSFLIFVSHVVSGYVPTYELLGF